MTPTHAPIPELDQDLRVAIRLNGRGGYSIYPASTSAAQALLGMCPRCAGIGNYPTWAGAANFCTLNFWKIVKEEEDPPRLGSLDHELQALTRLRNELVPDRWMQPAIQEALLSIEQSIVTLWSRAQRAEGFSGPEAWVVQHPDNGSWSVLLPAISRHIGAHSSPIDALIAAIESGYHVRNIHEITS